MTFLCFIMFRSEEDNQAKSACGESDAGINQRCVYTKDGQQICGLEIRNLCLQLQNGFWTSFFGSILMIATHVLFITILCVRRATKMGERKSTTRPLMASREANR
ncbi:hypothetical protein PROFUN_09585 [Planoprotostelium fungivorum]|uniref:Uncharacterized protein n=1 Tax=Planoprotostelium fungivorum TaxID=1890364 RepID=A0A2P6NGS6_9EUKA|nr:hypothetical protein PROFUN_09585 [Planoprotostelium fungivorum]